MMVGYARVSTEDQTTALQIDALTKAGCELIFRDEGFSGSLETRPALDRLLRRLKPGDTLVTWKLDRLSRSLPHLISLISLLERRRVGLKSLSEAIDTATTSGRFLFHVIGALAEFERSLASERTKAGIAAAKRRGATIGRPTKLTDKQIASAAAILKLRKRTLREVAHSLAVSRSTLLRSIQRHGRRRAENSNT